MNRIVCLLVAVMIALSGSVADGKKRSKRKSGGGKPTTGYVYICTGPGAYAYHSNPYCSGLNRCSYTVKKVPKSSVSNRRACQKCY